MPHPSVHVHGLGGNVHSRPSFWGGPSYGYNPLAASIVAGAALGAGAGCCTTDRGCLPVFTGLGVILLAVALTGIMTNLFTGLSIALLLIGTIIAIGTLLSLNDNEPVICCRP